jgi:hypothetical protein
MRSIQRFHEECALRCVDIKSSAFPCGVGSASDVTRPHDSRANAVFLRKTWLLAARSADARKPFRPSLNGDLFDKAFIYLLKIRRAEDARDLRRTVASRLGNFLLRLRRIPTGGEQDCVVPMPVTRVGALGHCRSYLSLGWFGVGTRGSFHPSVVSVLPLLPLFQFVPFPPSASIASIASTSSTRSTASTLNTSCCYVLILCRGGRRSMMEGWKDGRMEGWKDMGHGLGGRDKVGF